MVIHQQVRTLKRTGIIQRGSFNVGTAGGKYASAVDSIHHIQQQSDSLYQSAAGVCQRLSSIKGVGTMTVSALLAKIPELGTLSRREISALVATRFNSVIKTFYVCLLAAGKTKKWRW